MDVSILIVSKNRKKDLALTLRVLEKYIDKSIHEIRVLLDGCEDQSLNLKTTFPWVHWYEERQAIGASRARHKLYKTAKGKILIGFDDDAHPLHNDFIQKTEQIFQTDDKLGAIAYKEIKGLFNSDIEALKELKENNSFLCSEFVGCGFAIKTEVYQLTNGFPVWMDIYGEEACVSLELLSKGYNILFTNNIAVNHRIDKAKRKQQGKNYFRFQRQLKNSTFYYLIYYKWPLKKICKLYYHNFMKYGLKNVNYFLLFFKVLFSSLVKFPSVLNNRNPVRDEVIAAKDKLKLPM
ncbi:MAG: hypothetical protein Wins2KO_15350 [Winogradskyella sp.]